MIKRGYKRMIKKGLYTLWGVWCAVASLITPAWLTLTYLNISGEIYKYDYTMDEGTALVFGMVMAIIWLLVALLPTVLLIRRIYKVNRKYAYAAIGIGVLCLVVSVVCCGGNMVSFLNTIDFI